MNFFEQLRTKTGYFYIRTPFTEGNEIIVQDADSSPDGIHGHLRTGHKTTTPEWEQFEQWLIYPEPGKEGQLRIVQKARPHTCVTMEPGRVKILPKADSDGQRFVVHKTTPPKHYANTNPGGQWFKIQCVAGYEKGFGVNSVGIPFLSDYSVSEENDRTKFWFEPVNTLTPDHSKLQAVAAYDFTKKPQDFDGETKGKQKFNKQRISVEAIPSAMVGSDGYSAKIEQILDNPYYYLEYWIFWREKNENTLTDGIRKTTVTITDAFSKTTYESIERTIGHMFRAEIEAGYQPPKDEGGLSGSIKLTYQFNSQTKRLKGSSNQVDWSKVETEERTLPSLPADQSYNTEREWVPIHQYILKDAKGNQVEGWEYEESTRRHFQKMKY